jgi:hypothetical protein
LWIWMSRVQIPSVTLKSQCFKGIRAPFAVVLVVVAVPAWSIR